MVPKIAKETFYRLNILYISFSFLFLTSMERMKLIKNSSLRNVFFFLIHLAQNFTLQFF